MRQLNRSIKEKLRQLKCRYRSKPKLSHDVLNQGQQVLAELRLENKGSVDENKTIWMFWDSGLDNAPGVVQLSYKTWCKLNPDYKVILLTNDNLYQYLGFEFNAIFPILTVNLGAAGKSDLLRLHLLNRYGGVWVDATTFCLKPLSQWLDISYSGFFCFREKHSDDRNLVSWFLASKPGHPIIEKLLNISLDYLTKQRANNLDVVGLKTTLLLAKEKQLISKKDSGIALLNFLESKHAAPYFWVFYLFNEVVKLSHNQLTWQHIEKQNNLCAEMYEDIISFEQSYVSKQTYREKYVSSELYQQRAQRITELLNV
ncbi:capsular polysaccharide synthesis protein [Photobacterium aphoticum]|uniref:Capsular polysaccharide synthesis protein n=1 Tax=Photobacterium aphoticum TaxID=754436 RepID=A0A0J1JDH5_9GAMM|nr:capsular polysaccharide synthesis protein [Photobacterium aphoticum]KLU99676.1 hypothetical protein ABT58_16465 [Photobacterium aphoticum]PSU55277.1 hypothetical protein C9I90_16895 [Photobacterium aphoticum]